MTETIDEMQNERHSGTITDRLRQFLRDYYREELGELAADYPDRRSVTIDYSDVFRFSPDIADDLREQPEIILDYFDEALRTYDYPVDVKLSQARVRVENVPEEHTYSVGSYRSENIGQFLGVTGQVTKRTAVQPKIESAVFECQRCSTKQEVPQSGSASDFQEPHECQGCERQGPFRIDFSASEFTDYQKLRVQQPPEETKGADGTFVDVELENDLVNAATPGSRVTIAGQLNLEQRGNSQQKEAIFDQYIESNHVNVEETDFDEIDVGEHIETIRELASSEDAFDVLCDSIAPSITGEKHEIIKEAIALQMFGGNRSTKPDGTVVRGDSHILMLGDPGTGKSALLRAAENIAPRSTFTSGKGATKAGMTAAAVPDDFGDSKWSLEAGALVLANKGLACVDEIDKVDEDAISSLHGALEAPQQVEIHKAGINATLPSQTSLLAGGNPKHGRFDPYEPVGDQFELGPTLLSRFDLIFTLQDTPDPEKDGNIAETMINTRQLAHHYHDDEELDESEREQIQPAVDEEVLRAWIAHARQSIRPKIPEEIREKIRETYKTFRNEVNSSSDSDSNPVPLTARKLDAMQRLSEASAKARLSEVVEQEDVDRAMKLIRVSLMDVGQDPETGEFDADIVEAGTSKSQRDRIRTLENIITQLESDFDGTNVPLDDVYSAAEADGISREKVDHQIEKWRRKGELSKYEVGDETVLEWF